MIGKKEKIEMRIKKGFYLVIIILIQLSNNSVAQSFKESEHWKSYQNFLYYQEKEDIDSALICLHISGKKAQEDSSWNMYLWYKNEESRYLFINDRSKEAVKSIQEGLHGFKTSGIDTLKNFTYGWSFGGIGFIYYSWSEYNKASKYFLLKEDHLLKLKEKYPAVYEKKKKNVDNELMNVYLTLATCYQTIYNNDLNPEDYYKSVEYAQKAWEYCKENRIEKYYSVAIKTYGELLSELYPLEGMDFLEASKEYIKKGALVPYYLQSSRYHLLNKEYTKALERLDRAKECLSSNQAINTKSTIHSGGENHESIDNYIGNVYFEMGDIETAIETYKEVIKVGSNLEGEENIKSLINAYQGLAKCYNTIDDINAADSLSLMAAAIIDIDNNKVNYFDVLFFRADLLLKKGDYSKRDSIIEKIESLLQKEVLDNQKNAYNETMSYRLNLNLAKVYAESFLLNDDFKNYQKSLKYYYIGFREANELSYKILNKSSLAYLSTTINRYFPYFMEINYKMYEATSKQKYISVIIDALGNNKSRILGTLMKKTESDFDRLKLSDKILNYEKEINKIESKLLTESNDSLKESLRWEKIELITQLFNTKIQQERLYKPQMPLLNAALSSDIKSKLDTNEAILEYYLNETDLYTIVITNTDIMLERTRIPENFRSIIRHKKKSIKTGENEFVHDDILTEILIAPVQEYIESKKHLHIIPDVYLYNIPLETLKYKNRYLIHNFNISYSYSSLLVAVSDSKPNNRSYSSLIVAPEFSSKATNADYIYRNLESDTSVFRNGALVNLPYAKEEAKSINSLFKQYGFNSKLLIEEDATKENYIENVNQYSISHLSTHGYSSTKNPFKSCVFFTNNDQSDNFILMNELYDISLKSDLVILSACKTGTGQIIKGEGMLALPAGFIYAGVPNVIASLWKVHDEKTKVFMVTFYEHLLSKKITYTEALQLTKLDCINKGFLPIDWAGFVLIGE